MSSTLGGGVGHTEALYWDSTSLERYLPWFEQAGQPRPPMSCPRCGSANDPAAVTCFAAGRSHQARRLPDGFMIASRYEILSPLGTGGMGMVYKAHDRVLDEDVAIKVLRAGDRRRPRHGPPLPPGDQAGAPVRHRNVCGIHEYGEDGGPPLHRHGVRARASTCSRSCASAGRPAGGRGLRLASRSRRACRPSTTPAIIHRDLKTPNIMRDTSGVVRVMDFGIAKQQGSRRR